MTVCISSEWGGYPVCWWFGLNFYFACCLDETSCTGCYWWLGDVEPCIQVVCFVWVLTIWYSWNGNPLQYSCQENPMDAGAWWATVHGSQRVRHNWTTPLLHFMVSSLVVYGLGVSAPTPKAQDLIFGQEWRFHIWFVMALSEIKTNIQKWETNDELQISGSY